MKIIHVAFAALVVVFSSSAFARNPEPLVNYPSIPVATGSGKALTADQVCQTVRAAAEEKKWQVAVRPDGRLMASLSWNSNKHTIVVEVACTDTSYSVMYLNSVNMKFSSDGSQMTIHPHYNRFVKELNDSISVRFMTL